uniref:Short-chain dehydrogenase/reductase n=1 Tax=Cajanus cajan TaxID=3821 RepID=A0A151TQW9_CAJCA|nr:(+)-neomenthol dehydrogenase [Cajanus cajan]
MDIRGYPRVFKKFMDTRLMDIRTNMGYAVVTGANKGIGFAICKQLASNGITVVLTARDETRGLEAVEKLKELGLNGHVLFHQLDVADPASIGSLADFIRNQFGKLDILVNNAGIPGAHVNGEALVAADIVKHAGRVDWSKIVTNSYELTEAALKTNYYGAKELTTTLIPLLQLSSSPKIVNVSSSMGRLENIPNGWPKEALSDVENLTEEKIDEILNEFLKDFKEGSLETKGWPLAMPAYSVSKAALNAYTRVLAKKHPSFCINALCPGYVKTDINYNAGILTPDEGAEAAVRLALLPHGAPSGLFFFRTEEKPF